MPQTIHFSYFRLLATMGIYSASPMLKNIMLPSILAFSSQIIWGKATALHKNYTVEEKQVKNAEIRQKNCPLYKGIFDNGFIATRLVRKLYPNVMLCG